jgi:aminoglycoside 3-N-acetyltransferase
MDIEHLKKTEFLSQFKSDLSTLGVRSGDVLMVHPALRPFGYVPGGTETIIQGLLAVLGPSGTLLMPALTFATVTPQNPVFDVRTTPSCVGAIAEAFRLKTETSRSLHPTHSVCALGPLAEDLLSPHIKDVTPCGQHSPFTRLPGFNGKILMLACSLIYNTSMHAIEELVEPPYLYDPPIVYTLTDEQGQTFQREYIPHNFRGWRQRYDRAAEVMVKPALRSGPVVEATSYLLDAKALWEAGAKALKENKLFFADKTNI